MTEYHEYQDSHTWGIMPACDEYHLPKHIQEHVDYVFPGAKLVAPVRNKRVQIPRSRNRPPFKLQQLKCPNPARSSDLSQCDITMSPACLAALYKIPAARWPAVEGNSMVFSNLNYNSGLKKI
jgi:tripeptidyl-peptidase I